MRGNATPWFGFSLPAVFIASWRRSLSVPKPTKQNGRQFGDHSSIWDSWPIAFSGHPRGTRVGLRLRARGTQRLTSQLRLALEPERLENPTATAREIPGDGADSIRDTQAVCGFRCWASKLTAKHGAPSSPQFARPQQEKRKTRVGNLPAVHPKARRKPERKKQPRGKGEKSHDQETYAGAFCGGD